MCCMIVLPLGARVPCHRTSARAWSRAKFTRNSSRGDGRIGADFGRAIPWVSSSPVRNGVASPSSMRSPQGICHPSCPSVVVGGSPGPRITNLPDLELARGGIGPERILNDLPQPVPLLVGVRAPGLRRCALELRHDLVDQHAPPRSVVLVHGPPSSHCRRSPTGAPHTSRSRPS